MVLAGRKNFPPAALPGYSKWSAWAKRVPAAYRLRQLMEQQCFDRGYQKRAIDLYHEPSLWPLDCAGPMVMTLHDLTHLHYPQTQPADRLREIQRRLPTALERAQVILADSHYVAQEIQQHYGIDAARIQVAPLGYAERFHPRSAEHVQAFLNPLGLTAGRYLLCVGTLEPRKNLQLALRAYALLPSAVRQRYPLVLAGMSGWQNQELDDELQRAITSSQVQLTGYLNDEQLAMLLSGARMLLFPSLYEGFGLPVLEAMASAVPVVLSNSSAMPEVAGAAGTYAENDPLIWRDAILRLTQDSAYWQQCKEAGLQRAQQFSWARCAHLTAAAYQQALEF